MIAANTNSVNANSLGLWIELDAILAVVIGGTSLAGGRFSLTGTLVGALFIATLARTDPQHRHPVGAQLPLQGRRRHRRVPPPVAEGPRALPGTATRRPGTRPPPSSRRQVRSMSATTVPADSLWDRVRGYSPPPRYLPVIATLALLIGHVRHRRGPLRGLLRPAGGAQPADRQRLPDRRSPSA